MHFLAEWELRSSRGAGLRAAGHDVLAVPSAPGTEDAAIIDTALREQRIFVTEDRDFEQIELWDNLKVLMSGKRRK